VKKIRIASIGTGMHFQETYGKALQRPEIAQMTHLSWVADLASKEALVRRRVADAQQDATFLGIDQAAFVGLDKFDGQELPQSVKASLDRQLAERPVDGVLISTTPEQHRAYTNWALRAGLRVLLDKPVTSRPNAASIPESASGILDDWRFIDRLSTESGNFVLVNSHRRFHPAYAYVGTLLQEVVEECGIGVTSMSSFSSDGQWRLPNELEEITYHGYEAGNGVLSHFGYHYLDLLSTWYRKGTLPEHRADRAQIYSSFSTAANYAKQIPRLNANAALVRNGEPEPAADDPHQQERIRQYGEVDSFNSIDFLKDDTLMAHASLQLLHSGFSQRQWTVPAKNLYKENGRVRWENHLLQQGPLHAIEIRSFQAVQPARLDPEAGLPRWELGGADHLEINVFRNGLIGGEPLRTIQVRDLLESVPQDDVLHEDVKASTLRLFVGLIAHEDGSLHALSADSAWRNEIIDLATNGTEQDRSLIASHQPTVALMSAAYESHANRVNNRPPVTEVELQW